MLIKVYFIKFKLMNNLFFQIYIVQKKNKILIILLNNSFKNIFFFKLVK